MGATNVLDRFSSSIGILNGVVTEFRSVFDVPNGGVLFALPSLLVSGLLREVSNYFVLPKGYYTLENIFLLLAFMSLCRMKSIESLRYSAPGEWGKILGLDRIPEVRTLRKKIHLLSDNGAPEEWSAKLCSDWMESDPESAGILYVDGHVRVYHGHQTKLPAHYVARQRLCLRATTDYWVNAMNGQPFFRISKAVDPGLLEVLQKDIVGRLEEIVPNQPSVEKLEENKLLHRFTVIIDREGYSPDFIKEMKDRRVAVITYHKYPKDDWPKEEFIIKEVRLASGNVVRMRLAERGVFLSKKIWVREVRKLTDSGHQTSILATDFISDLGPVAAEMFGRWSQENFFKYMRQHYNLDNLISYSTEHIPDTTKVVNPEYRLISCQVRSKVSILNRKINEFGAINLKEQIDPDKMEEYMKEKAELQENISHLKNEIETLKNKRKTVDRHIKFSDLPEKLRFVQLGTQSKHFIDTIKMIAYRAETAMASIMREKMSRTDDTRSLLRAIYNSEADIIPDKKEGMLRVILHHQANKCEDETVKHLCKELNETKTLFPGTNLRMVYSIVSD